MGFITALITLARRRRLRRGIGIAHSPQYRGAGRRPGARAVVDTLTTPWRTGASPHQGADAPLARLAEGSGYAHCSRRRNLGPGAAHRTRRAPLLAGPSRRFSDDDEAYVHAQGDSTVSRG